MDKLIEIEGRMILVSSKKIEINGRVVVTQGDIKILNSRDGLHNRSTTRSIDKQKLEAIFMTME
ncbi:MAG TPA: hypothetical protein PLR90_04765 [Methylophilus sp.]|nr:hypothetical protein [Methylophilus sp.]HQQ33210.1 hypothetical protein [Methylophilus sp.]